MDKQLNQPKKLPFWASPKFKVILISLTVVAIGASALIFFTTRSHINQQVSQRGLDYIKKAQDTHAEGWEGTNLEAKAAAQPKGPVTVNKCLRLNVPFPASEVRIEGECTATIFLTAPIAHLVLFARPVDAQTLSDASDVIMRRQHPDQYVESKLNVGNRTYTVFANNNVGYEKSAFLLTNGKLFVMTISANTNENLDSDFSQILGSVEFI